MIFEPSSTFILIFTSFLPLNLFSLKRVDVTLSDFKQYFFAGSTKEKRTKRFPILQSGKLWFFSFVDSLEESSLPCPEAELTFVPSQFFVYFSGNLFD